MDTFLLTVPFGAYMDHLKGFRKEVGKSPAGDLIGGSQHHNNPIGKI